jgi:NADPH-dependent 2,4-dienoyl-CoA reductase/sulfur reductase-like enzyme
MDLISKAPTGPIETRWDRHRFSLKLVNPANKRKHTILVVGSGLAGASAAASLAELGYQVTTTTATASTGFSTTPSRAAISARANPTSTAWRRSASR